MASGTPTRFRLAALLVGTVAALVLAELVLRVVRPASIARTRYPCIYEPDPDLGFRYVPGSRGLVAGHFEIENAVEMNSLGFYDAEPLPPGEAAPRILAVGDSFTAAMNVKRDEVWTAVLERALRARGLPRADVVNLGLDGTGTDVHVAILRRYLPRFAPEIVVVAFYANDLEDVANGRFERECYRDFVLSYQTPDQRDALRARVDAHREKRVRRWLHANFHLARLLHQLAAGPLSPYRIEFLQPTRRELGLVGAASRAQKARVAKALRDLVALARECRCRLVVAPVPARRQLEGSRAIFSQATTNSHLEVLDVLPEIERRLERDGKRARDLFFEHDAHLNAYGNAVYADALARLLAPQADGT